MPIHNLPSWIADDVVRTQLAHSITRASALTGVEIDYAVFFSQWNTLSAVPSLIFVTRGPRGDGAGNTGHSLFPNDTGLINELTGETFHDTLPGWQEFLTNSNAIVLHNSWSYVTRAQINPWSDANYILLRYILSINPSAHIFLINVEKKQCSTVFSARTKAWEISSGYRRTATTMDKAQAHYQALM